MKHVTIFCSDPRHPVNPWLVRWSASLAGHARANIVRDVADLTTGDFLFLVSCHQVVGAEHRRRYRHCLVLHASDLPRGRGMSPHIWQILEGARELTVSLLNAEDEVDSGDIWRKVRVAIPGTDLSDEINAKLFAAELDLMSWALDHCDARQPRPQSGQPTHFRRRVPADSQISADATLAGVFDLLRVADPDRFPAYFIHRGQKYRIRLDKM